MAKILIVDDSSLARYLMREILEKGGHEVIGEAESGHEAVIKYRELQPEVTMLDIEMADKDGIAALEEIVAYDPKARIIMASSVDEVESIGDSLLLGAYDFIPKPYDSEWVLKSIAEVLSRTS